MKSMLKRSVAVMMACWSLGCSSTTGPASVCVPGTTLACLGAGRCEGVQTCSSNGAGYGVCDCNAEPSDAGRISDNSVPDAGSNADGVSFTLDNGSSVLERNNLAIDICQIPGFHGGWQVQGSDPIYTLRVSVVDYAGPGEYRGSSFAHDVIVELGSYATGSYTYADNSVNGCEVTVDETQTTGEVFCSRLLWADESVAGSLRATMRCSEGTP